MDQSPDKIYEQHKGLIRALVSSIVVNNPGVVSTEDLQQTGALALMVALRSYDASLGSFQSYIRKCIRNALLEQANSFNGVFTVDEKVRRTANKVLKLRNEGMADEEIMNKLGIRTKSTFLSLVKLTNPTIDVGSYESLIEDGSVDGETLVKILDELELNETESRFINLVIKGLSMEELGEQMNLGLSQLYKIRASIRDKILAWGQD